MSHGRTWEVSCFSPPHIGSLMTLPLPQHHRHPTKIERMKPARDCEGHQHFLCFSGIKLQTKILKQKLQLLSSASTRFNSFAGIDPNKLRSPYTC